MHQYGKRTEDNDIAEILETLASQRAPTINVTAISTNVTYEIITPGDTNFTLIGAADSNPGTIFTASSVGTGTGTAKPTLTLGANAIIAAMREGRNTDKLFDAGIKGDNEISEQS